jgi:hypothetical protein
MTPSVAVHCAEGGTAIITHIRDHDHVDVLAIERLPAGLDPAVTWLTRTFPDLRLPAGVRVIIDADGLGQALWDRLGITTRGRTRSGGWRLYTEVGKDRQEIVNALLVGQSAGRIAVRPTPHEPALRKALLSYKRTVGDDGVIGGEMVVALGLTLVGKVPGVPKIY